MFDFKAASRVALSAVSPAAWAMGEFSHGQLQMSPCATSDDQPHNRMANPKFSAKCRQIVLARAIARMNLSHLLFSQFAGIDFGPMRVPQFVIPVHHIVAPRPNKKVTGIDTDRIVAVVTHDQAIGDHTPVNYPGQTVGFHAAAFAVMRGMEPPITIDVLAAHPEPTTGDLMMENTRGKSSFYLLSSGEIHTLIMPLSIGGRHDA